MRKISIISIIIAAAFVSCSKEIALPDNTTSTSSFIGTLPKDDTKTSLNGLNVLWSEGDQVDVVYDKASFAKSHATFTLDGEGGSKIGRFSGAVDLDGKDLFVVYPTASYGDGVQTISIPSTLNYAETNTVIPMYGLGNTSTGVVFHHMCSVIHVPVYAQASSGIKVSTVRIENECADKISGRFFFKHSSESYNTSLGINSTGNYKTVEIICNDLFISEDPENPTDFYFVVRGGIQFKPRFVLEGPDGVFAITKNSIIELNAGKKISFEKVYVDAMECDKKMKVGDGEWTNFDLSSISSPFTKIAFKSTNTTFETSDLSSILSLVASQSSAVALDMSEAKVPGPYFPTCNESVTNKLTSIKLPEGVTKIKSQQFSIATGILSDIFLPSTVNSIGYGVIVASSGNYSSSLKLHVDNASMVDVDGVILSKDKKTLMCFPTANTVNYATYTIPSTVTEIAKTAFVYGKKLEKLTIPASVRVVDGDAFLDCMSLKEIVFMSSEAPTLSAPTNWGSEKPTRVPGYRVDTGKKLTIPLAADEASYNAAGWTAFTGVGYAYDYWMQPQSSGATISNPDENYLYSFNFWE